MNPDCECYPIPQRVSINNITSTVITRGITYWREGVGWLIGWLTRVGGGGGVIVPIASSRDPPM